MLHERSTVILYFHSVNSGGMPVNRNRQPSVAGVANNNVGFLMDVLA